MRLFGQYSAASLFPYRALKLIGVGIFLWILSRIDIAETVSFLLRADPTLLLFSLFSFLCVFVCRAARLCLMARAAGQRVSFLQSWRIYNLGIFLASITPGKVGEFGRAVYFRKLGMSTGSAVTLGVFDRIIDQIVGLVMVVPAISILFGMRWFFLGTLGVALLLCIVFFCARWSTRFSVMQEFAFPHRTTLSITLLTLAGWAFHYGGVVLLSWSVGVSLDIVMLFAIFTITAIVTSLPIAPSGLGTRDATLIVLLQKFSIAATLAVALSQLVFIFTLILSSIGFLYWLQGEQ